MAAYGTDGNGLDVVDSRRTTKYSDVGGKRRFQAWLTSLALHRLYQRLQIAINQSIRT